MNDIIAQQLLTYIANNLITESRFLTPEKIQVLNETPASSFLSLY